VEAKGALAVLPTCDLVEVPYPQAMVPRIVLAVSAPFDRQLQQVT